MTEGDGMRPLQVSAQFAAFVWYSEAKRGETTHEEALRFARQNWVPFLPAAHEGWGKLLIRVAKLRPAKGQRRHAEGTRRRTTQDVAEAS
jgi:hypothetical protein